FGPAVRCSRDSVTPFLMSLRELPSVAAPPPQKLAFPCRELPLPSGLGLMFFLSIKKLRENRNIQFSVMVIFEKIIRHDRDYIHSYPPLVGRRPPPREIATQRQILAQRRRTTSHPHRFGKPKRNRSWLVAPDFIGCRK